MRGDGGTACTLRDEVKSINTSLLAIRGSNTGGLFRSNDQISFSVATVTSLIGGLNIWKSLCVLQLLLILFSL
jgi:hypothetical protein